jgi:hypothetical protein
VCVCASKGHPRLQRDDRGAGKKRARDHAQDPHTHTLCVCVQLALYSDADVVIGLHGAGLTNALFARRGTSGEPCARSKHRMNEQLWMHVGVVVVEFKSWVGATEIFRKVSQAREGGLVHVPLRTPHKVRRTRHGM